MDLKVYTKETVSQPEGSEDVYVPNVIDIIPDIITDSSSSEIRNHVWNLEKLKAIADVKIIGNKLYINSDKVTYENGTIYVTIETEKLFNAETVEGKEELTQACALATIWQKGLDPLDLDEGVRWSEILLGEINVVQLMNDISEAVSKVSNIVTVVFDTVEGKDGNSYMSYKIRTL